MAGAASKQCEARVEEALANWKAEMERVVQRIERRADQQNKAAAAAAEVSEPPPRFAPYDQMVPRRYKELARVATCARGWMDRIVRESNWA